METSKGQLNRNSISRSLNLLKRVVLLLSIMAATNPKSEAGANAVADKDINKLHITLAQLASKPAELQMFQEAYADKLASSIEQSSTGQQLLTKLQKLTTSPTERTKINAVFGPHGADKLETLLLRNQIYNMAPRALGSPQNLLKLAVTQGAQSLGMGVAGGAYGRIPGWAWGRNYRLWAGGCWAVCSTALAKGWSAGGAGH